jgi:hypothetical protein
MTIRDAVEQVAQRERHHLVALQGACLAARYYKEQGWAPSFQFRWATKMLRERGIAGSVMAPSHLVKLGLVEKVPGGYWVPQRVEIEGILRELGDGLA